MRGDNIDNLAAEIKSEVDEYNEISIDIDLDLIPLFNRANSKAWEILVRSYPDPILEPYTVTYTAGSDTVDLPEHLFGDRVKLIVWEGSNNNRVVVDTLSLRQLQKRKSNFSTVAPDLAAFYGRKIIFSHIIANTTLTLTVWAARQPDHLVRPFGRIISTNSSSSEIYITDVNTSYDVTVGDGAYLNIVDGATGEIKGSIQASTFNGTDTVKYKTSPDYTTVLDRTISNDISDANRDDYLCYVRGTCVIPCADLIRNFIYQYALSRIKRNKLGQPYDVDSKIVGDLEADLRRASMGRANKLRIEQKESVWSFGSRAINPRVSRY